MIESAQTLPSKDVFPGLIVSHEPNENYCTFKTQESVLLKIEAETDSIIRFRYSPQGFFEKDFSYAISPDFKKSVEQFIVEEKEEFYLIQTSTLDVQLFKKGMKVRILDKKGLVLSEDEKGFHWEEHPVYGGQIVKMTKKVQYAEHFYGLGDKPTKFNLYGKRLEVWGMDEYGFHKDSDPIYKNIPFYIGLHHETGYGIFFDNSFKSHFDFASERKNVTSFWAQGGEMNYYFIYGPEMLKVVENYTELTGKPELPPLWTLGYHQCKWSYYPESQVREITEKFRELQIPCDAIYLDIDYMDGFRCFTWDKEKFPNFKQMIQDFKEDGFKTVVMIDPGIKVDEDYWVFKEAFENDYFCRRADGPLMVGKVWPGDCCFPDFTNPKVRTWWAGLYKEFIAELGIQGVWNDMNEPAIFEVPSKTFPDDVRHDYDGHPASHRKTHNVYGMQMAQATFDGMKKYAFPNRPFVITRSAYSGAQRFTSGWTGDNIASWEHLWLANVQCQRMAISGFSFIGSDIGGFIEHPSAELYVRWIQLGIFHPFCRTHSSGDHGDQEPWSFGEASIPLVRKFIELRYQLLPYIYTTFWQYSTKGTPMLRPISFVDQGDKETSNRSHEFLMGDNLLVCPMLQSNVPGRYMYLIRGKWYDWWTDEMMEGGREIYVEVPLDKIPIYVKAGAVLPFNPVMQYVGEKKVEELTLHVYYKNGEEKSELYEDRGEGYDYQHGDANVKHFYVNGTDSNLVIRQEKEGNFKPEYKTYKVVVHGLPFEASKCRVGSKVLVIDESNRNKKGQLELTVKEGFSEIIIE
jgi:alpha-glucosidase